MTITTKYGRLMAVWSWFMVTAILFGQTCWAEFTNKFDNLRAGSSLTLTWDAVPSQYAAGALCVTAQLIETGKDGHSANGYKANVTISASGTSFTWKGIPFPLRHTPLGMYQVELRPAVGNDAPLLAKSQFFTIDDKAVGTGAPPSSSPTSTSTNSSGGSSSSVNKPLAIGLGVAIGVPSIVALVLVGWCFRKRQRKATMEKRRQRRRDFIIN